MTSRTERRDKTTGASDSLRQYPEEFPVAMDFDKFPRRPLKAESAVGEPTFHDKEALIGGRLQSAYEARDIASVANSNGTPDVMEKPRHR